MSEGFSLYEVVMDLDRSIDSRDYVRRYADSGYFGITAHVDSFDEIYDLMDQDKVDVALVIPAGFAKKLASGRQARVQTIVDGSYPPTAKVAIGYSESVSAAVSKDRINEFLRRVGKKEITVPVQLEPRVWYNPSLWRVKILSYRAFLPLS